MLFLFRWCFLLLRCYLFELSFCYCVSFLSFCWFFVVDFVVSLLFSCVDFLFLRCDVAVTSLCCFFVNDVFTLIFLFLFDVFYVAMLLLRWFVVVEFRFFCLVAMLLLRYFVVILLRFCFCVDFVSALILFMRWSCCLVYF